MTSTDLTVTEQLRDLRDELQAVYYRDGRRPMFDTAKETALSRGVLDVAHLVYVVYSIAEAANDRESVASAVAQYAHAALADDEHAPEGICTAQRCAYIAAMTLLEFQDADRRWGIYSDQITETPWLTFETHFTVDSVEEVLGDGDGD
jgi:hypothetical protein